MFTIFNLIGFGVSIFIINILVYIIIKDNFNRFSLTIGELFIGLYFGLLFSVYNENPTAVSLYNYLIETSGIFGIYYIVMIIILYKGKYQELIDKFPNIMDIKVKDDNRESMALVTTLLFIGALIGNS